MFGFGRSGKIKRTADKFVEAMVMEAENLFRSYLQIILQSLMDDGVEAKRTEEIVNAASPSLVCFAALFSYELVKAKYSIDDEISRDISIESIKAMDRKLQGPTGEAMRKGVLAIIENINIHNRMMPIGEEAELDLIGWNSLKFFDFDANPEIRQLMDNSECKGKLNKFLEDASGSWWKTAEKIGSF